MCFEGECGYEDWPSYLLKGRSRIRRLLQPSSRRVASLTDIRSSFEFVQRLEFFFRRLLAYSGGGAEKLGFRLFCTGLQCP